MNGERYPDVNTEDRLDGSCGENEVLDHWGLMVGKAIDNVEQDESAWERAGIGTGWRFSSFVAWGTVPGRRYLVRPRGTRVREKDRITAYRIEHSFEKGTYCSWYIFCSFLFGRQYFWFVILLNGTTSNSSTPNRCMYVCFNYSGFTRLLHRTSCKQ